LSRPCVPRTFVRERTCSLNAGNIRSTYRLGVGHKRLRRSWSRIELEAWRDRMANKRHSFGSTRSRTYLSTSRHDAHTNTPNTVYTHPTTQRRVVGGGSRSSRDPTLAFPSGDFGGCNSSRLAPREHSRSDRCAWSSPLDHYLVYSSGSTQDVKAKRRQASFMSVAAMVEETGYEVYLPRGFRRRAYIMSASRAEWYSHHSTHIRITSHVVYSRPRIFIFKAAPE